MIFPGKDVQRGETPQRELLSLYLEQIKAREMKRLKDKARQIEEERALISEAHRQVEKDEEMQQKAEIVKREKFKKGIEEMKLQKVVKEQIQREWEVQANSRQQDYFPYTHGDHVEHERECLKAELRDEFKMKQGEGSQRLLSGSTIKTLSVSAQKDHHSLLPLTSDKKEALLSKFAQDHPLYYKKHDRVIVRKPNEELVKDALEDARKRFESQLLTAKLKEKQISHDMNRYNQEHISYYNEIEQQKQIQLQQNRAVLEYQREEAAQRKLLEKLDRRAT